MFCDTEYEPSNVHVYDAVVINKDELFSGITASNS